MDEVHERQQQTDVLLIALRELLQTTRPDLKVILVCYKRACLDLCRRVDCSRHQELIVNPFIRLLPADVGHLGLELILYLLWRSTAH